MLVEYPDYVNVINAFRWTRFALRRLVKKYYSNKLLRPTDDNELVAMLLFDWEILPN